MADQALGRFRDGMPGVTPNQDQGNILPMRSMVRTASLLLLLVGCTAKRDLGSIPDASGQAGTGGSGGSGGAGGSGGTGGAAGTGGSSGGGGMDAAVDAASDTMDAPVDMGSDSMDAPPDMGADSKDAGPACLPASAS